METRTQFDFPQSEDDLGKLYSFPDGRSGVWLGCMENDDECAFRDKDGNIFFVWRPSPQ